ncbi:Wound-induced polypeptide 1 [Hibiscus trionum]|uniref:Wound-induced polypeptide 1 n=1 Tax=Hibiscus trionum TaxID=183268 RepID=A0A9W7HTC2_HIBTR|nr:Wound-induced polypeptide 1 [Hibiscus trionum]
MSYLSRVCMAASVAAVEGHIDCGSKWSSGLQPIHAGKGRCSSTAGSSDDTIYVQGKTKENNRNQSEESLQRVMYLNCWTQS